MTDAIARAIHRTATLPWSFPCQHPNAWARCNARVKNDATMARCRNLECRGPVDGDRPPDCPPCAGAAATIVARIIAGTLPQFTSRAAPDGSTMPVLVDDDGISCAACGRSILREHVAYIDDPHPPSQRGADLHVHYLCHEIWRREAALIL